MDIATLGIIGTVAGSVLGVMAGTIGTYFFSKSLSDDQRRYEAATKFNIAFFDEIIICNRDTIEGEEGEQISFVIDSALNKHGKAMLLFRPFVSDSNLPRYDKAWEEYSSRNKRHEGHAKYKSHDHESTIFEATTEKERRHIVLSRIEKLIKFAPLK